jgi:hypothetical protein
MYWQLRIASGAESTLTPVGNHKLIKMNVLTLINYHINTLEVNIYTQTNFQRDKTNMYLQTIFTLVRLETTYQFNQIHCDRKRRMRPKQNVGLTVGYGPGNYG